MRLLTLIAIVCILMFAIACVPKPKEEVNITIEKTVEEKEEVKVDEKTVEKAVEEENAKLKEEAKPPEIIENKTQVNQTNTSTAATGPRTIVAGGMIEAKEGETIRVVMPD